MSQPIVRTVHLGLVPLPADAINALLREDAAELRSLTGADFPPGDHTTLHG